MFWDKAGVGGRSDPAADPRRSLLAWWKQQAGKDTPELPGELNAGAQGRPGQAVRGPRQTEAARLLPAERLRWTRKPQLEPLRRGDWPQLKQQRDDFDEAIPVDVHLPRPGPAARERS